MNIEINVPSSLAEITLGQYQKFQKIAENNPDGNFLNAKMIEIFCGIPLSDSYKLKMSSVTAILDILNEMLEITPQHVERFKMNGIEYGFIPDLDEMSLGEYIDLDNNASNWEQMDVAMNVLYRPIKTSKVGKYNIEDYDVKFPEVLKDMPLDAAIGSLFFFYNLGTELAKHTIQSLDSQAEMEVIQEQLTLAKSGVGINQFMDSLTEILQNLKISLN
tara:strand:- start:2359 stop:3012 length:654 start_codon:yes stop_codon:yes gene_type:complete